MTSKMGYSVRRENNSSVYYKSFVFHNLLVKFFRKAALLAFATQ